MYYSSLRTVGFLLAMFACLALPLQGCQQTTPSAEANGKVKPAPYLISSRKIGEFTPAQIQERFSRLPQLALLTRYSVTAYKLVYRTTTPSGKPIQASGALLIPKADTLLPLLSQQHGTIENDASAPSYYNPGTEVWSFGTVLSSIGYVVAAPDYLGYGTSNTIPHPYQHAASLASASADMLRATREFCAKNKVQLNGQLFLSGYSEGGFATMALHKKLEEELPEEFTVTASAPGAGAYHTTAFAQHVINSEQPLNFINTYLWVLKTYNQVYKLNRPLSHYLTEPYASQLQKNAHAVVASVSPRKLFKESFRNALITKTDTAFLRALSHNNLHDWKPKAPIALFHGTADDYVPYFNSEDAYNAMRRRGATQVELMPIHGGDHFTSVGQYSVGMLLYFGGFREKQNQPNSTAVPRQ